MAAHAETTTEYLRRKEREGVRVPKPTLWEECDASPYPFATKMVIGWFLFVICGLPLLLAVVAVLQASIR